MYKLLLLFVFTLHTECSNEQTKTTNINKAKEYEGGILVGADRSDIYLPMIKGKRVACVVNQTSLKGDQHLVDFMIAAGVDIKLLFAPEHGIRGKADAGEKINNSKDIKTGLPIISLYGDHKKPTKEDLAQTDVIIFDIQDVGVRFYTYISTLHFVMEAAAEQGKSVIILDRPNPNGDRVDGPVLEPAFQSFVGMHEVPILYGMTIGEYGLMINQEKWLNGGIQCKLDIVTLQNYTHQSKYKLPVKPSPNLPNSQSIQLYPSLCLFEGTTISVGRGTDLQFQVYGHPAWSSDYCFVPKPNEGAKYPKHQDKNCCGLNLSASKITKKFNLTYLMDGYQRSLSTGHKFFNDNNFFEKLAGTSELRNQLIAIATEDEIRLSWQPKLEAFKKTRNKYLLYK